MNKSTIAIISLLAGIILCAGAVAVWPEKAKSPTISGGSVAQTAPLVKVASSTAFSISQTSARILGTTTANRRLAATIQPINCTVGSAVFLKAQSDAPAVANSGPVALASSTLALTDYPNIPVPQNAVQAITQSGTCTVIVTEWLAQ
jgi:hypothetical protein